MKSCPLIYFIGDSFISQYKDPCHEPIRTENGKSRCSVWHRQDEANEILEKVKAVEAPNELRLSAGRKWEEFFWVSLFLDFHPYEPWLWLLTNQMELGSPNYCHCWMSLCWLISFVVSNIFLFSTLLGGDDPIWLIFFKWVGNHQLVFEHVRECHWCQVFFSHLINTNTKWALEIVEWKKVPLIGVKYHSYPYMFGHL